MDGRAGGQRPQAFPVTEAQRLRAGLGRPASDPLLGQRAAGFASLYGPSHLLSAGGASQRRGAQRQVKP